MGTQRKDKNWPGGNLWLTFSDPSFTSTFIGAFGDNSAGYHTGEQGNKRWARRHSPCWSGRLQFKRPYFSYCRTWYLSWTRKAFPRSRSNKKKILYVQITDDYEEYQGWSVTMVLRPSHTWALQGNLLVNTTPKFQPRPVKSKHQATGSRYWCFFKISLSDSGA